MLRHVPHPPASQIVAPALVDHSELLCPSCGAPQSRSPVCVTSPEGAVTLCVTCRAVLTFAGPIWFDRLSEIGLTAHQSQQVSVLRTALAAASVRS